MVVRSIPPTSPSKLRLRPKESTLLRELTLEGGRPFARCASARTRAAARPQASLVRVADGTGGSVATLVRGRGAGSPKP